MGQKFIRALIACVLMSIVAVPAAAQARMSRAERSVVKRINHLRADNGLRRLHRDSRLARAADAHNRDMLGQNFFAHPSSNGTSTYDRVRSYRRSNLIGETLAYMPVTGDTSPRKIVQMWIESSGHYAVMTTRSFRRIGVAKRKGMLFGQKVSLWTADFASRR